MSTYRVLANGLGAGGDGYTFLNERFRFEFSEEFDGVLGFRTAEERFESGKAASDFLTGGYDFVHNIFGLETVQSIGVVISPKLDGDANDARTRISWLERDGLIVDGSQSAKMYFGAEAFGKRSVLAHELTHALLDVYVLPAWFGEGIATLVEMDYVRKAHGVRGSGDALAMGVDSDGYNVLQTWRGHGSTLPFRSDETYAAAYTIVSEIRHRFGDDVFPLIFKELDRNLARLRSKPVTASDVVRAIERTTGKDARPYFQEIRFRLEPST